MALPKLNNGPKYEMTIPSTGKVVRFRPFVMKEQKALMIAGESDNMKDTLKGILDILLSCIEEEINPKHLAAFDVEYMFLQMRAKSVGETADIGIKCKECQHPNEMKVNVSEIKIDMPENINKVIEITDTISIEVDYPSYVELIEAGVSDEMNVSDVFKLFKACIRYVVTEDERINVKEVAAAELDDFVDSLTKEQFGKLNEFVDNVPRATHTVDFKCSSCGADNELKIEGITNFLG